MYIVIFRARLKHLDDDYASTAEKLRVLAIEKYGCKDFVSRTEGSDEITLSYWESTDDILAWKNDPTHKAAQQMGKQKWYVYYKVQVAEIMREYGPIYNEASE